MSIIILLASAVYLLILFYLLAGVYRHSRHRDSSSGDRPFVSVIVAAHNEEENLATCVEAIVGQTYPSESYEIILIDDHSTDGTGQVAEQYAQKYDHVKYIHRHTDNRWQSSKKAALARGIGLARGSILLFTDADCRPGPEWMESMVACYTRDTGVVAGFSPQQAPATGIWNDFLWMDSLAAALVTAGSTGWGQGITCTGRNLSYRKEAWLTIGGFQQLPDSLSGDDDFVLQKIAQLSLWHITYSFDPKSHVPALGPKNFFALLKQKRRHISAGRYFNFSASAGFAFYHAANIMLWFIGLRGLLGNHFYLLPLLAKAAADFYVLSLFAKRLGQPIRISGFLLWQPLYPLYHFLSSPAAFFGRQHW